jgi:hypothetical protein
VLSAIERVLFGRGKVVHGSAFNGVACNHVLAERFDNIDDRSEIISAKAALLVHQIALIKGGAKLTGTLERSRNASHLNTLSRIPDQASPWRVVLARERRSVVGKTYDEPSEVDAEQGDVTVDGPDGVAVSLTPDAAVETGHRLIEAGIEGTGQRVRSESEARARQEPQDR